MTKRTAKIAEVCRRAVTQNRKGYISNDIAASRLASVNNVKRTVIARHALNSVVDEWLTVKEEHKKWRLGK
jgi:hypothetical protein